MSATGSCEHCGQQFAYSLIHNGFNDSAYAYCDTCGRTALLSAWSAVPRGVPIRFHSCISKAVEPYLEPCSCGGHFRSDASPRCPHCNQVLSADVATDYLEANS